MAMTASISLLGLYAYKDGLFDGFTVPEGMSREDAINVILRECAPLELVYPDWDIMRGQITLWSHINEWRWRELWKTLEYEYDPIANYDRNEEWTDSANGTTSTQGASSGYVYGYDSETRAHDQDSEDSGTTTAASRNTHTGRVSGNVGVTSTQELIKQQRESVRYNIYKEMAQDFKTEFCVLVY